MLGKKLRNFGAMLAVSLALASCKTDNATYNIKPDYKTRRDIGLDSYVGFDRDEVLQLYESLEIIRHNGNITNNFCIIWTYFPKALNGVAVGYCSPTNKMIEAIYHKGFRFRNFKGKYIIALNDVEPVEHHKKYSPDTEPYEYVPYSKYPVDKTLAHEIGHIRFGLIPPDDAGKLEMLFRGIDSNLPIVKGQLIGHPSLNSQENSLNPTNEFNNEFGPRVKLGHQFAETFAYIVIGKTYQDSDPCFMKKRKAVEEIICRDRK